MIKGFRFVFVLGAWMIMLSHQEVFAADQVQTSIANRPQMSIGVNANFNYNRNNDTDKSFTALGALNLTLNYLTESRRQEFGIGLGLNGQGNGTKSTSGGLFDNGSVSFLPQLQYKIYTDPLGPTGNTLLFVGGNVGYNITTTGNADITSTSTALSYGPVVGALFFVSPSVALNVDNQVSFSKQKTLGSSESVSSWNNAFNIGIRVFF